MKLIIAALFFISSAFASDHIDGPITMQHRVADLTDLYAFPDPQDKDQLVIILNAYPLVPEHGHFSEKVNYTLHIREATIDAAAKRFVTGEEVTILCTFVTPHDTANHSIKCFSSNGLAAVAKYDTVSSDNTFKVYAGMRSDPFFFNSDWALSTSNKGVILEEDDDNTMANINVLSIALRIKMSAFFPSQKSSLFALAAETTTQDAPSAPLRRIDRVGRPEVTNVSLVAHEAEVDLRDGYNLDTPFAVAPGRQAQYVERLENNISFYDSLDNAKDWKASDSTAFANLIADDFLVVDISKPCAKSEFLSIEKSLLKDQAHATCGGRHPNDDIMDILFGIYITGPSGEPVSDGVNAPDQKIGKSFPYLADPITGWWAWIKASVARMVIGLEE